MINQIGIHTINLDFGNKIYGMINMEAIPKFDIKSDIKFDISIKQTTYMDRVLINTVETSLQLSMICLAPQYFYYGMHIASDNQCVDGQAQPYCKN